MAETLADFNGTKYHVTKVGNHRIIYPNARYHPELILSTVGMRFRISYSGKVYWARCMVEQTFTGIRYKLTWQI